MTISKSRFNQQPELLGSADMDILLQEVHPERRTGA
jgi:hypothetical protein